MLVCMVFGSLFALFGAVFFAGKGLGLVPGWKRMTREEQAGINIRPLCRNIGCAIALAGIALLAAGIVPAFLEKGLRPAMILWFVGCILDLLYIQKSGRYLTGHRQTRR